MNFADSVACKDGLEFTVWVCKDQAPGVRVDVKFWDDDYEAPKSWSEYKSYEDRFNDDFYYWHVPLDLVLAFIEEHGGEASDDPGAWAR